MRALEKQNQEGSSMLELIVALALFAILVSEPLGVAANEMRVLYRWRKMARVHEEVILARDLLASGDAEHIPIIAKHTGIAVRCEETQASPRHCEILSQLPANNPSSGILLWR